MTAVLLVEVLASLQPLLLPGGPTLRVHFASIGECILWSFRRSRLLVALPGVVKSIVQLLLVSVHFFLRM